MLVTALPELPLAGLLKGLLPAATYASQHLQAAPASLVQASQQQTDAQPFIAASANQPQKLPPNAIRPLKFSSCCLAE